MISHHGEREANLVSAFGVGNTHWKKMLKRLKGEFDKICPVQCSCLCAHHEQLRPAGQPMHARCHTYYDKGAKTGSDK